MSYNYVNKIKKINKYHYFLVNKNKSILLGSSNSNTDAKKKSFEKLGKNIDKFINVNIVRIKIGLSKKIDKKTINQKMIGGPIVLTLEKYIIKGPTKFLKNESNINYFFYKKDEDLTMKDLKTLAFKFMNLKYNASAFNIKYVKKIIK